MFIDVYRFFQMFIRQDDLNKIEQEIREVFVSVISMWSKHVVETHIRQEASREEVKTGLCSGKQTVALHS